MKPRVWLLGLVLVLGGCESRSISDSGYRDSRGYYVRDAYTGYRGELAESDVVGAPVNPSGTVSEADIRRALH